MCRWHSDCPVTERTLPWITEYNEQRTWVELGSICVTQQLTIFLLCSLKLTYVYNSPLPLVSNGQNVVGGLFNWMYVYMGLD